MKAFDILIFMFAFNFSLDIVILIAGEAAPGGLVSVWNIELVPGFPLVGVAIMASLVAGIIAASFTLVGSQVTKPVGVVATFFSLLYGFVMVPSMAVLTTFHVGETQLIPAAIITAIVALNIGVWIGALMQIATGGWRSSN